MEQRLFTLQNGEYLLTASSADAFRVQNGILLVYIVPVSNGSPGRRIRIYEASEGEVIPGFFYEDDSHQQWAFCLTALEQAQILCIPNGGSRLLKERFSSKSGIVNYNTEGYEGGIVDQYGINLVKEDSFIIRSQKQRDKDAAKTDELIRNTLKKGAHSYISDSPRTDSEESVSEQPAADQSHRSSTAFHAMPGHSINRKDLFRFCLHRIRISDVLLLILLTLVIAAFGLQLPYFTRQVYDSYIPAGNVSELFQTGSILASLMILNLLFALVRNLIHLRITSRISTDLQAAVYDRAFHLPESFFRKYDSADLADRLMKTGTIVRNIADTIISSAIALVCLIIYFFRMAGYSARLAFAGLLITAICCGIYYLAAVQAVKYKQKSVSLEGEADSKLYQYINGISKIRMAGAENRILYEYFKTYATLRDCEEQKNRKLYHKTSLTLLSGSVFTIIMYILIMHTDGSISLGGFLAFLALSGSFITCFLQIAEGLASVKNNQPDIQRLIPVLKTVPELQEGGILPGDLTGAIKIENVNFSYDKDTPQILKDVSVSICPGEYVGIVGPSGCGKSTLLKLLLGFETPDSGSIFYDAADLKDMDKQELRKKMGVVLQDGKLISGSIFDNITITSPSATEDDVWQIVREVGLESDIESMPMGLDTILSEDSDIISGGQRQRILIARAMISDPKIILFDEATSALDNITQHIVSEKLETLGITRIVIAHRLSTVISCDRILVMNNGRIEEQGTYDELMQAKGMFYQLARRQIK